MRETATPAAVPDHLHCMGGWCRRRQSCAHYHAGKPGAAPTERLCERGRDGILATTVMPAAPAAHTLQAAAA